jgi:carboxyl-terminal processing protease
VPDIEVLQEVPNAIRAEAKSESALRGHLAGQSEEQSGSQSYVPPNPLDDKALNMAVDLLRGVMVNSAFPPTPMTSAPK